MSLNASDSLTSNISHKIYNLTGNSSVGSAGIDWRKYQPNILAWTIATIIISILGCFNNFLVLFATLPRAGDKSGVNLLIFHFIIANFFNCLICVPIRCIMVQAKQFGYYHPTVKDCYFIQMFTSVNWLVVYWADCSLALNRFVALFFPHSYRGYSSNRNNLLQIAFMWISSIALLMPYNLNSGGFLVVIPIGHCAYRAKPGPYGEFFNSFKYVPFVTAGVASVLILGKCYKMLRSHAAHGLSTAVLQRIRLAKALVLTYVWAVLCNVPAGIIINMYPQIFENDPTANLWPQTGSAAQYAFSASLILFSNAKYRNRLRGISQRVLPLPHSFTAAPSDTHALRISAVQSGSHADMQH